MDPHVITESEGDAVPREEQIDVVAELGLAWRELIVERVGAMSAEGEMLVPEVVVGTPPDGLVDVQGDKVN